MYKVVEYTWEGERVIFEAKTEKEARKFCGYDLGSDDFGEEGLYITTPDGKEIHE